MIAPAFMQGACPKYHLCRNYLLLLAVGTAGWRLGTGEAAGPPRCRGALPWRAACASATAVRALRPGTAQQ
jgi:hypothetical protein